MPAVTLEKLSVHRFCLASKSRSDSPCSRPWGLYRLADGPRHFAALRRSLPDVSAKVLAQQLRELQADGLVSRERSGPVPALVHYALTPHGRSVLPVAEEIRRWGMVHQAAHANPVEPDGVVDVRAVCDVALAQDATPAAHKAVAPIK